MKEIKKAIKKLKNFRPQIAVILGSGFVNSFQITNAVEFDYAELGIKYQPIKGHKRKLIIGMYKGIETIFASRVHFYESGDATNILNLYKIFKEIGVQTVVATTAVGGVNEELNQGDLMLIKSHINFTGANPLIGVTPIEFVDLSNAYDKKLREIVLKAAKRLKVPLFEGVHIQDSGPSYESFAEVVAFRKLGADTVSMSTALDAISAAAVGIKFLAFAGITNKAISEISPPLEHEEVVQVGSKISEKFFKILDNVWLKL